MKFCIKFCIQTYRNKEKNVYFQISFETERITNEIGSLYSYIIFDLLPQVRRLSERGEGSGPTPREAAFLATLSQAPTPQPGGRRHSVVTISRVPPTLFGRNRRESIAAFPMGAPRILPSRRDSTSSMGVPPSNSGSTHNLQLDIMDDIAEIKARKVSPEAMDHRLNPRAINFGLSKSIHTFAIYYPEIYPIVETHLVDENQIPLFFSLCFSSLTK